MREVLAVLDVVRQTLASLGQVMELATGGTLVLEGLKGATELFRVHNTVSSVQVLVVVAHARPALVREWIVGETVDRGDRSAHVAVQVECSLTGCALVLVVDIARAIGD